MGENLITMSEQLATLDDYADIMTPGLPEKQATLEQMIFDDDGKLRPMFEEFIIDDQYMIMMITFSGQTEDRKSTRLNSSHVSISYAVFCLKKKKMFIIIMSSNII